MTDPLTALRSVPVDRGDIDAARRRTHQRIDELTAEKRHRRLPTLVVTLVTATAAATVVLTTGGTGSKPAIATAATVLRDLADTAGEQPKPELRDGEYYAVRVVQADVADPEKALDLRYWEDANGKGREVGILNGRTRKDVPLGTLDPKLPPGGTKLPELAALPTDDAGMAAAMRNLATRMRAPAETAPPTTRDYVLAASQMIGDQRGTPPAVLRAIFRFLSVQPGMQLVGDVVDPLGRPGMAVAADGDADHKGIGVELIVNPDTGRPLAMVLFSARRATDVQPARGAIGDELLVAADLDLAMAGRGLDVADLDLRARPQALGLEPRQQAAVLLGLADDLAGVALAQIGQRDQLQALLALVLRGDGPAVRAAVRVPELRVQALDHLVGERGADAGGVLVRLRRVVVQEVREEALDDPAAADDVLGAFRARGGQDELAPAALFEQALGREPLEHLADGRARDAERLRDPRRDRRRSLRRLIGADGGDEQVDRL
jgi:hypothetical protein